MPRPTSRIELLLLSLLLLAPHRTTAIFGLLASGCDLAYCLTFLLAPSLQVVWLASGGLFWMIWHLLIARMLLRNRLKSNHEDTKGF